MSESTMMGETENGAAQASENIEVWSLRRERKGQSSEAGLAVESCASQACARQKVGERFHVVRSILYG